MSRQQLPPQIRRIELDSRKDGRPVVRYELIIDTGTVNGRRKQIRRRYKTEQEARRELGKIIDQRSTGTYVHKRAATVAEVVEEWLTGQSGWKPSTWTGHRNRLKPLVTLYGDVPVQALEKSHIAKLMERLETGDIPRPKDQTRRPSNGQSRRNILNSIRMMLNSEVEQGHLPRNVAQFVPMPKLDSVERRTLDIEQLRRVLDVIKDDRDGHQHHLGALGLRKCELAELKWTDIDLDAHTFKIARTRVVVDGKVVVGTPKTERSTRELPIPDPVYTALLHARAVQAREKLEAGDKYQDSGYVVVDELGRPYYPDYLTDAWKDACRRAGVPVITSHERRHTYATLMLLNGESPVVVSALMGHADPSITLRLYAHVQKQAVQNAAQSWAALVTNRDMNKAG